MPARLGAARLAALAAAMAVVGCLGETSAPQGPRPAAFSVLPSFPSHAAASVPFDRVRVTLSRSASTALDTTIAFPAGADSLAIRLTTEIFGASETMTLNLAMIDAANDTVFRGGPVAVTLTAIAQPAALPIALRYVGVGANAKSVRITPKTTSVALRDSATLIATAYDAGNQPIPGTPVSWRSLDSTVARVPADTVGKVLTGIVRGVARVVAILPTGIADTAQVTAQPVAVAVGLLSGGGQTGGVGALLAQPMVVRVKAADSVGVAGVPVNFVVVGGGGVVSKATDTTNATGDASTIWTLGGTLGEQSLKASVPAAPGIAVTLVATGVVGAPKRLAFLVQPPTVASGAAMVPAVQVVAQDSFGNTTTNFTGNVSLAIGTNPGPSALGGATTVQAAAGVATFSTVTLNIAGTGYTLTASATGLAGATSNPFNVTAAAPAQLAFALQPSNATAGAAISPVVTVQVRDASGNLVASATTTVTVAIGTNPGGGTLSGTTTVNAGAGVASFSSLSIDKAGAGYTLAASAGALTGATSAAFNVAAGAASRLVIATQPSSAAQSGAPLAQQPVIQLQDALGNVVSQSGVVVTAAIASGGGTLGATATATTNASGVATFTSLSIAGAVGARTLSFTATGLVGATSGTITLAAGTASQLAVTTQPSSAAQSAVVFAQQPVIQIQDAAGNAVSQSGVVVTAAIASGGGTLGGTLTATTAAGGAATFTNLSIAGTVGARTLTFTASGLTSVTSGTITLAAGAATQLAITTQPSSAAQSGAPLAQQPVIQLQDALGNAVSQSGVVVTATIASGGGTLGGTLTVTTSAGGTATFTNLSITGLVGARTLSFTAAGLTGATSGTITVTAGAASRLSITTQPSAAAQSGVAFAPQPVIQLQDASGNALSQSGVVVTAAIASGGGTLGGTLTATTSASGTATFTNLSITGTVGARTLTFTASGLTSVTSGTITLAAGAATQLAITTQPSSAAQSGVAFAQQPVTQLQDASGNAVSQSGVVVTAAIASGGGTLGGTLTVTTSAGGTATFTNLSITGLVGARTLSFTAAGLTGATSGTITVTAGAASRLAITTQPSAGAQSGVAFAPQPVTQVQDASGNAVSQSGVVVTAAIASGGGTLGGTLTATTSASGTATFTNLSITGTSGPRTLTFTAIGLVSVTSGTIVVGAGAPTQLAVTTQPSSSAQSGVAFAQQPVVQLRDSSGNVVSQSGVVVTAAIASGGGTLGGTLTVTTSAGGAATFTNLFISGTVGARTLTFTASGLTSATSGTVTITAGPASQLAITTPPSSSAQSGAALAQQPVIQLQDASGNTVSQSGVVVTAAIASGGGTLGGTLTATTSAGGTATFTNLSITGLVGSRTLSFTATGVTGATSGPINVTAGTASQLVITTEPPASVAAQSAFGLVVAARDGGGNTVTTFTGSATVAFGTNPAGGTLSGTLTVGASSGVATFSGLSIDNIGSGYVLTATSPGLTSATSTAINVTAPPGVNAWINPAGGNWSVAANWSKGVVPVATDTVTIAYSGTYTVNLDVSATVAKLTAGAPSGTQTLAVGANTLSVGAGNGAFAANTVLNLSGTGTITGVGTLTVAGAFNWTGGNLGGASGAGGGIQVLAGGALSIAPTATVNFVTYTLGVAGAGTWTGDATVQGGSGAVLRVAPGGTLTVQGDPTFNNALGGALSALNVAGRLIRSTSANPAVFGVALNDSGTVSVTSGTLRLAGGGTGSGAFTVASGTALDFNGGNHVFGAASAVTGGGTVSYTGGTVNTAGSYNVTGKTSVAGGAVAFNGASATTTQLDVTAGNLTGAGLLTVSGPFNWTGGNLGGASGAGGTTRVLSGGTLGLAPTATILLVGYTLELAGNGTFGTTQTLSTGSGAVLRVLPGATLTVTADPTIDAAQGGAATLLDNQGTITRTTSAAGVTLDVPFNQAGALNINSGFVNVASGGTMSGPVTEAAGTVLLFSGGSTSLANKFAVSGSSGMTQITGGTVGGLAPTDTAFFDNLTIAGGLLSLAGGTIKTPFEMLWTGAASVLGGTLFVPATAGLTMSFTTGAPTLQNATLLVAGSGGWTATTPLGSGSGAVIRVLAGGNLSLSGAGGGYLYNRGGTASVFDNRGTVISATTPGTAFTISAAYTEQGGTLNVNGGRLRLAGGSTPPFLGTATVNTGDTLELAGGNFLMNGPLTIGGGGTLLVSAGTLAPNGVGLGLSGNFATSGTGALVMNLPGDSLEISSNATFGGAAGTLSNGVIRVGGNFTQTGGASFAPGPNTSPQRVVLTGSGPQTIGFADPVNSFFRRLQSNQGANGNITLTGVTRAGWFQWIGNNAMLGTSGDFIADTITGAATGSNITVNKVELSTLLNTSGFFGPDTTVFTGANQVIPSLYGYHSIRVAQSAGTATFSGNPGALTSLVVSSGTLSLTGRRVGVTGFFQTSGTGALQMTAAGDSLGVGGSATFGGGSTSGLLTAGIITVNGDFVQTGATSPSSYAPTLGGTHRLSLRGTATQYISMANPAAAQSHFDVLEIGSQNRNVVLQTSAFVNDTLWMQAAAFPYSLTGWGTTQRLMLAGQLRMDQSTSSPKLAPPVVELAVTPTISPTLANTFNPDTTVFNAGIANLPTGSGIAYKSARVNTGAAFTSPGNVTFNGDLIASSGTYTMGSGVDSVAGFLRTEGTGALSMVAIVAAPTLAVRDSAVFAGGPSTALSGGSMRIWGNFVQRGTGGQFAPTGTRVTLQRAAAGAQTIQFADSSGSFFRDLVFSSTVADTIRLLSNVQVQDSTVMNGTSVLVSNAAEALKLPATGILRVHSQAVLKPFRAEAGTWVLDSTYLGGTTVRFSPDTAVLLNGSNFYGTGTIGVAQITSTPSPLFAWKSVRLVSGALQSTSTSYDGDLIIQGGGYTLYSGNDEVSGFLRTEGTGTLTVGCGECTAALVVKDSAVFAGGASQLYSDGTLRLLGNFVQRTGATAFQADPSSVTELGGFAAQTVSFANPDSTAAGSYFGNLSISNASAGGVTLATRVFALGQLQVPDTSGNPAMIFGSNNDLDVRGLQAGYMVLDNQPLVVDNGAAISSFYDATWQNMNGAATQFYVRRAGGNTYYFSGLTFSQTLTTGLYVHLRETDINESPLQVYLTYTLPMETDPSFDFGTQTLEDGPTTPILTWLGGPITAVRRPIP